MANPQELSLRIMQGGGKREEPTHGRHHSSPYRFGVGRPKKERREYPKSPMKKTSSYKGIEVQQAGYDVPVFTITAYLPGHDSSEGERRLKVRERKRERWEEGREGEKE